MNNIKFEWDDEKNRANVEKHGVSFYEAIKVFEDEFRIEIYDYKHSSLDEDRYDVIGIADNVLFVVYAERSETTRLISARYATKTEREMYEERKKP